MVENRKKNFWIKFTRHDIKSFHLYKKEVRITDNKKGEIFIKTNGAAGGLLFMGDLCRELFDLINQHKRFRIEVSYNPKLDKTRFEIIEYDEDDRCQET